MVKAQKASRQAPSRQSSDRRASAKQVSKRPTRQAVDYDELDDYELDDDELDSEGMGENPYAGDGGDYLDDKTLELLLESAQQVGLDEFDVYTEKESRAEGDVFYVIASPYGFGDEASSEQGERIATVYSSQQNPPTYDADAVASFIASTGALFPLVVAQLLDTIAENDELIRARSAAAYLAGQVYSQSLALSNNNEQLRRLWLPFMKVLGVSTNGFDDFLNSLSESHHDDENTNDGDADNGGDEDTGE